MKYWHPFSLTCPSHYPVLPDMAKSALDSHSCRQEYCFAKHSSIGIFCLFLLIFSPVDAIPQLPHAGTPLQQFRYQYLPASSEIAKYLHSISLGSRHAKLVEIGRSVQYRPMHALLISTDRAFFESGFKLNEKLTVMMVGSQHPSEASGAEALQILAHELIKGGLNSYLEAMNFIIIADSNPDGRALKTRTNANGVNLSTDYLLLSQPESRSIVKMLRQYEPDALIDLHESALWKKHFLGAEGFMTDFEAQLEVGNQANIDGRL